MTSPSLAVDQALDEFHAAGALRTGHFILSSELRSPAFREKMFVLRSLPTVRRRRLAPAARPPELATLPPVEPGSRVSVGAA